MVGLLGQSGGVEELGPEDRAALRRAVFALRSRERRRVFPARLHLGDPDGDQVVHAVGTPGYDDGLRADVVAAMLRRRPETEASAAWLTRPGVPDPHDLDALWLPALLRALSEAGEEPRWLAVVTKSGWYAPLTGQRATWQRLRIRSRR